MMQKVILDSFVLGIVGTLLGRVVQVGSRSRLLSPSGSGATERSLLHLASIAADQVRTA